MKVKLVNRTNYGEYVFDGKLDSVSTPKVQQIILDTYERFPKIVLNFERLQYLSSAGLRLIKVVDALTKEKGINFVLTNVPHFVMEVLEMTGFAQILTIE